ncbi:MAG: alcohol dehydrogenase catalytic domain-containing protein [Calditrichaeota bacterium]|jgi:threonine dehydrogenase-like Zn-dependent dehydrogenase|nr:alcohol dehydrogenase catalytic domain-containing protein [Calditrichota bacterium]
MANLESGSLEKRLFEKSIKWLKSIERRDFYQKLVEFCASVLESDVCALYVKTTQIGDGSPRVCLVAGKLPKNHPEGQRMDPTKVGRDPKDHSYKITNKDEDFDGITGRIATTGKPESVIGYVNISGIAGHIGRFNNYVWERDEENKFKCMLGVPIHSEVGEVIGVVKVENHQSGKYKKEDELLLSQIGSAIASSLSDLISAGRELKPEIPEYEYTLIRSAPKSFEKNITGEVIIKHSMTAICQSDTYYFEHRKSRKKLDERLPLVLGHETTGEVYQVVGNNKYLNSNVIQQGHKVVVIPLIPCRTCDVCKGTHGENYCPSSRFMASNAPGSLRTLYKYDPRLILKISDQISEEYALFTEPMSCIVQMLIELGFEEGGNTFNLNMAPYGMHEFSYFHVAGDSFSNIFDTITAEEPIPRKLFVLTNSHKSKVGTYRIKHSNLMSKGLGLLGDPNSESNPEEKKIVRAPKILIMGGGTMGYLLALLLSKVYKIEREQIVVTGRDTSKLIKFQYLATRHPIGTYMTNDGKYDYNKKIALDLENAGNPGSYDLVFECVGWPFVEQNIELALRVLKDGGIIAMEGLAEQDIEIDFKKLLEKRIFIKGFYRGSIEAYMNSLRFIEEYKEIRPFLESLIDNVTTINGQTGFHKVTSEQDLEGIFNKASTKKAFGRLVISRLTEV